MDTTKIYVVQQGASSYSNVDEVNYVFLDEAAARAKHAELAADPEVCCDEDDRVWTQLWAVTPGCAVGDGELLTPA
jgi:hypothetical protein